ncbi:MAG: glutamate--cysteine ligase [Thermoleophilia bacterium]|nr:glutamate--cysteine ligase [Thermoleophilia bacterium]
MGLEIDRSEFTVDDEERFSRRLHESLDALGDVLRRPGFGAGPPRIGMELEMSIVDGACRPLARNEEVLERAGIDRLDVELNRFNVEYNSRPLGLRGDAFSAIGADLRQGLTHTAGAAEAVGGRVAIVGILPTLREADLQSDALTDRFRFHALSSRIRQIRQAPFRVRVDGPEPVDITCDDVTLEGANTSLQVHLQASPDRFARVFNAVQLATGPVLGLCGNSPFLVGRRCWEETRVALFRQAVDDRAPDGHWRPARVSFGHGWVRTGALELFAESVALHAPLLPVVGGQDPRRAADAGAVPALDELRLHHGTVWRWNRAVYDPDGGGSVRIELRALPAGPTVEDMIANAALLVGASLAVAEETEWMTAAMPFRYAEYNFMEAARRGLDATFLWPARRAPSPRPVEAPRLLELLIGAADGGLASVGVDRDEREHYLGIARARLAAGTTGARWQVRAVAAREAAGRGAALAGMLDEYLARSRDGAPVHTWGRG